MPDLLLGMAAAASSVLMAANYRPGVDRPWRGLWIMVCGGFAAWLLISGVVSGLTVVKDMRLGFVSVAPGDIVVKGVAFKAWDCKHVSTEAFITDRMGHRSEATLSFVRDRIPGNSRPVGWILFEPWRVEYDQDIEALNLIFVHRHTCGLLWGESVSVSGPFPIPAPRAVREDPQVQQQQDKPAAAGRLVAHTAAAVQGPGLRPIQDFSDAVGEIALQLDSAGAGQAGPALTAQVQPPEEPGAVRPVPAEAPAQQVAKASFADLSEWGPGMGDGPVYVTFAAAPAPPVDEPGAGWLLAIGLVLLGTRIKRATAARC